MISAISIEQTGTMFMLNLVNPDRHKHIGEPGLARMMKESEVIVCPLRHPKEVWASQCKRGEVNKADFEGKWDELNDMDAEFDIHFLPIDSPKRDGFLADMEQAVGRRLLTDWRKSGSMEGSAAPDVDLSRVFCLPLVRRFYDA